MLHGVYGECTTTLRHLKACYTRVMYHPTTGKYANLSTYTVHSLHTTAWCALACRMGKWTESCHTPTQHWHIWPSTRQPHASAAQPCMQGSGDAAYLLCMLCCLYFTCISCAIDSSTHAAPAAEHFLPRSLLVHNPYMLQHATGARCTSSTHVQSTEATPHQQHLWLSHHLTSLHDRPFTPKACFELHYTPGPD
jgi:hypothetical protein